VLELGRVGLEVIEKAGGGGPLGTLFFFLWPYIPSPAACSAGRSLRDRGDDAVDEIRRRCVLREARRERLIMAFVELGLSLDSLQFEAVDPRIGKRRYEADPCRRSIRSLRNFGRLHLHPASGIRRAVVDCELSMRAASRRCRGARETRSCGS